MGGSKSDSESAENDTSSELEDTPESADELVGLQTLQDDDPDTIKHSQD